MICAHCSSVRKLSDVTDLWDSARFKQFGKVRYARIVYDPTTKRSRGTAFVCMWNDADAQEVLRESETLNAGLGGEVSTAVCERRLWRARR